MNTLNIDIKPLNIGSKEMSFLVLFYIKV